MILTKKLHGKESYMEMRDILVTLVLFAILVVMSIASSDLIIKTKDDHVKGTTGVISSHK
jgi:hypothetical protein